MALHASERALKMSSPSSKYIEFQNIHFYYSKSNPVLNGINMHINKGNLYYSIDFS